MACESQRTGSLIIAGVYACIWRTFIAVFCFIMGPFASNVSAAAAPIPFFSSFPKIDKAQWQLSDGWANGPHQSCEWRADAVVPDKGGLTLVLSDKDGKQRPIGCAELHTIKPTGFGLYETRLRAAKGSGLNTAFFTYIGPPTGAPNHDEIDFEFLGKSPRHVEVGHYVNGKHVTRKVLDLGFDATTDFHDYAFEWTPEKIRWLIDQKLVYETANNAPIPQHQTRLYLSLWSGSEIENDWMGPFTYTTPVTADVAWVRFTPLDQR